MKIQFKINAAVTALSVIEVFKSSGINRPVDDAKRIEAMLKNSNLIVTAWNGVELIGIARSLTDFNYCCYLSDLAVKKEYQKTGIGKSLIEITQDTIGEQTMLLLLSATPALEYYPKIGFEKVENGFIIKPDYHNDKEYSETFHSIAFDIFLKNNLVFILDDFLYHKYFDKTYFDMGENILIDLIRKNLVLN